MQEFQLANKLIEALELYLINKNLPNSTSKLSSSSQMSQAAEEKQDLIASPNKKSLVCLYNQREIINKLNSHEELNCILNILKSQNFLCEEKIEDCKKNLKEYKRLWNILIIKDSFPMLNTLKKIYHVIKIRLHYLNNTISKGLKHLNFLSNLYSKNDQENLQMQISKLNNFGILNLKQKKISLAQFNFKNGLNLLKKFSHALNFNSNISQLAETLLFNLALSYFFEKKFEACYRTLKKIKQAKITCNPFYVYRLGISCLEMELTAIREKNSKESYNDLLEKYVVKNSQFNNSKEKNNIVDYSNRNDENKDDNKILNSANLITSPKSIENKNTFSNYNNNLNDKYENKNDNMDDDGKTSKVYNSYYILKNTEKLFFESEKISEAINSFTSVITLIKNLENLNFNKELSELSDFFNLNNNNTNNTNNTFNPNTNTTNDNIAKNKNKKFISNININNPNNNNNLNNLNNNNQPEKLEKQNKPFPKSSSKSFNNILISSYLNLLFCLSLKNRWTEMLFFINDLEASNLPLLKELNYTVDNYKIEAYMGLNQSYKGNRTFKEKYGKREFYLYMLGC